MAPRKSTKHGPPSQIRAECFMLCDVARLEHGKLYVLGGGWDRIMPDRLPMPYGFQVAIKLAVPREATTRPIDIRLGIVDELGRDIDASPSGLSIELEKPTPESPAEVPIMIPLGMEVTLVLPGSYRLALTVNGEPIAHTRFRVTPPRPSANGDPDDPVDGAADRAALPADRPSR